VVATVGNERQIAQGPKPRKQAKSVATGCHRLPEKFHGKEGVRRFESVRGASATCLLSRCFRCHCGRRVGAATSTKRPPLERQRPSDPATALAERVCEFCGGVHPTSTRRNLARRRRTARRSASSPNRSGASLTGMKKHIRLLEGAEPVTTEKIGRARRCTLVPCAFEGISTWLQRLDRFAQVVERTKGAR
jgi:hypothetical protein